MAVFSDEQIQEILLITMQSLGTHQYIGSRYVPIFGRKGEDTWEWDNAAPYEPLTVVQYQGVSYTSRQYVPMGIGTPDLHPDFWAETGNYNAQIEAYRQEVLRFDDRITANSDAIADFNTELGQFEDTVTANNWVTTNRIANSAVTSNKLADGAVTNDKITKNAVKQFFKKGIIFIGDSFIAGSSNGQWIPTFPEDVANALNADLETYAIAGIGWGRIVQSKTLYDLCNTAASNSAFLDYDDVTIIVYGGINDFHNAQNLTTIQTNMDNGIRVLNAAFNHPKIIMCGINLSKGDFSNQPGYFPYFKLWKDVSIAAGGNVTFYDARGWLASDNRSYAEDGIHPVGAHGNDLLKNKFISLINGSEVKYTAVSSAFTLESQTITTNTWFESLIQSTGTIECTEGVYTLKFNGNDFEDFTNNISLATAENIGKKYAHGRLSADGIFDVGLFTSSRLAHAFEPWFRTSQKLAFYPQIIAIGGRIYTWIKIVSTNSDESGIAANSWYAANESWSIL